LIVAPPVTVEHVALTAAFAKYRTALICLFPPSEETAKRQHCI
jgi:hypothetical protein